MEKAPCRSLCTALFRWGERRWEKEKRGLVSLWRRGGYPPPMDDREGVRAYFVLSLARSNVTVSVSVSPLRETVSVALSPAE